MAKYFKHITNNYKQIPGEKTHSYKNMLSVLHLREKNATYRQNKNVP